MKLICFLYLNFSFLFNVGIADPILTKSEILKKSNKCFRDPHHHECRNLIYQMEQMQLAEYEKNKLKCQTSILGLQTELVESYYFKKVYKKGSRIMSPYVIKNC